MVRACCAPEGKLSLCFSAAKSASRCPKKTGQFVFVASENLYFKGQEVAYDFGCSQTIKCSFSFFKPCRFKPPALDVLS